MVDYTPQDAWAEIMAPEVRKLEKSMDTWNGHTVHDLPLKDIERFPDLQSKQLENSVPPAYRGTFHSVTDADSAIEHSYRIVALDAKDSAVVLHSTLYLDSDVSSDRVSIVSRADAFAEADRFRDVVGDNHHKAMRAPEPGREYNGIVTHIEGDFVFQQVKDGLIVEHKRSMLAGASADGLEGKTVSISYASGNVGVLHEAAGSEKAGVQAKSIEKSGMEAGKSLGL